MDAGEGELHLQDGEGKDLGLHGDVTHAGTLNRVVETHVRGTMGATHRNDDDDEG